MAKVGIVLVTVDSQESGLAIAETLVSARLAACVNLFPIHSVYRWEGKVQQAGEWQLVIKTDLEQFDRLEAQLQKIHPYEVPEILALPVSHGAAAYLQWVAEQTSLPMQE